MVVLVALALSVGYWNIRPERFAPQTVQPSLQPDFFMDNPRIRQFMQGEPDGPVPFHFPAGDYVDDLLQKERTR